MTLDEQIIRQNEEAIRIRQDLMKFNQKEIDKMRKQNRELKGRVTYEN